MTRVSKIEKMTPPQKDAHTKKWQDASKKAHKTSKNAKAFTKYFLSKGGYKYLDFDTKRGYEYKGIVDLVALKRDNKEPDVLKIVLFQIKGGSARVSDQELKRLEKAVRIKV